MSDWRKHNYIFQAESDRRVRQWHFSHGKLFAALGLASVLIGALLFFSADFLTRIVYQNKLIEIRKNYTTLSSAIIGIQSRLDQLNTQIAEIEEKDQAVRFYADLPLIDQDIRELGIGGIKLEKNIALDDLMPEVETKISEIEMDIDKLARTVRLELSSYKNIYDKVKEDTEKMQMIPSIRPVLGGYLNSGFGYRKDPMDNVRRFHYGLDITLQRGSSVFTPADGVVKDARYHQGGFGKYIKIDHGSGYSTIFAHLSQFIVKKGQRVKRGDIIGQSGNTGRSTAPHLHYEIHYYGTPQNPMDYFFSGYLK